MHVVGNAIDKDVEATGFIDQIANNGKEIVLPTFVNQGRSVFHGKYGLNINLMVGVCHVLFWYRCKPIGHPYGILQNQRLSGRRVKTHRYHIGQAYGFSVRSSPPFI